MADQSSRGPRSPALSTDQVRAFTDRAPRCKVRIAVLCQPPGLADFVETQLVNVSNSGMFLASHDLLEIGTSVEFQFSLDDGVVVLRGTAEVVRRSDDEERGMGLRFVALDDVSRRLIDQIVEVNAGEPPDAPGAPGPAPHAAPGNRLITFEHGSVRIVLSAVTAPYFTYNPLLHIGIGGCFIPTDDDVPLGTGYQVDIVDEAGQHILRCKARVAAKQERRIGIRLVDVDRDQLLKLRADVAKLAPAV